MITGTYEENQDLSVGMIFLLTTLPEFERVIELDDLLSREDDRLFGWWWLLSCLLHFRVKLCFSIEESKIKE